MLEIALRNQPKMKAAAAAKRAAHERKGEADAPYYPTVNAYAEYVRATYNNSVSTFLSVPWFPSIGGYTSVDADKIPAGQLPGAHDAPISFGSNDSYTGAIVVQQDVYDFGRRSSGVERAEAGIDYARSDAEVVTEAIVYGVRTAYFGLLGAEALEKTAGKALAEAQEHLDWAHEAVKDGLRAPVEEVQAKADVTRAQLLLVRATAGVRVARVRLLQAIGEENIPHIEVMPSAVPSPLSEGEAALLDRAYRQRPDLAKLSAQRREAEATMAQLHAEFFPRLWAQGSIEVTGVDPGVPSALSAVPDWDLGLVLAIPIFEGFLTTHQQREASENIEIAAQRLADLKLTVAEQVREAFVNFQSSLEAVEAADANKIAAEEELKVVSGRYNNGLGSILELVIAQANSVAADEEADRARYGAGVARSFLDLAIGTPVNQKEGGRP
ncbi:MAG: TolC family protein [Deltaproteobacteria bacterium]